MMWQEIMGVLWAASIFVAMYVGMQMEKDFARHREPEDR